MPAALPFGRLQAANAGVNLTRVIIHPISGNVNLQHEAKRFTWDSRLGLNRPRCHQPNRFSIVQ